MLSLSSFSRVQRESGPKDSDNKPLASGASGINMDSVPGSSSHSNLHPATTAETRVTGGSTDRHVVRALPVGQIGIENGIVFEEERLNHL